MNFLAILLFWKLRILTFFIPLKIARMLASLYGNIFYYFIPIRKVTAKKNLQICFPEKTEKEILSIIKGCYKNVITVIFEFFYMDRLTTSDYETQIKVSNPELIKEKLSSGKGLIIVCAHFGNWEWMAFGVSKLFGYRLNVIVKEQSNKKIDSLITKIRESGGNRMINMPHSLKEGLSLLRNNEIVAMLGDQTAPVESNVRTNFFVNEVPTFGGAAAFAIKTGAALVFGVPFRNSDGTYKLRLMEIDTSKFEKYSEEAINSLTQEHVNLLKEAIIEKPSLWLWFHRRFKHVA